MKKPFRFFTAIILALALCLVLAGCGEQSTTVSPKDSQPDQQAPTVTDSISTDPPAPEGDLSLESYLDSIRPMIDSMISSADIEDLNMEVKAEGNSLVYSYQYTADLGLDNSIMKAALDTELEKVSDVFQGVLISLQEAVPTAEAVVVRYLDYNGQLITRRTWDAADISITPEGNLDLEGYLQNAFSENQGITLEEYLESIRSELDAMIAAYSDQGMYMDVYADGDSLVYAYQYTFDLEMDNQTLKEALDSELDKVNDTFEEVLAGLKAEVPSAKSVVVQYWDYTGQLITQRVWGSADQGLGGTQLPIGAMDTPDPLLESYVSLLREELADQIAAYAAEGLIMDILADGRNLVYRYQYAMDLDITNEDAKAYLDSALAENDELFSGSLTAIQSEIPSTEALVVQYWDVNGNLITEQSWR